MGIPIVPPTIVATAKTSYHRAVVIPDCDFPGMVFYAIVATQLRLGRTTKRGISLSFHPGRHKIIKLTLARNFSKLKNQTHSHEE